MRQDDNILGAKELHTSLQSIRQYGMTKEIVEQLNSRAINKKQQDIPNRDFFILLTQHLLFRDNL